MMVYSEEIKPDVLFLSSTFFSKYLKERGSSSPSSVCIRICLTCKLWKVSQLRRLDYFCGV